MGLGGGDVHIGLTRNLEIYLSKYIMGCSPFKGLSLTDSGTPGLDGQHPPSKTPVGVLPWTCRSDGKCQMTEQIDWRAKQLSQVACCLEDLKC